MATVNLSAISVAMSIILMDGITDQFRRDAVLLNLLDVKTEGGQALYWNPKFDGRSAGGAYAEGADMADADYDSHTKVQATLSWAQYRKGAKVSGLAEAVSQSGGYAGSSAGVFDEELTDAVDDLALDIATHLYSGDPTASPVEVAGAAIAIDSSTASTFANVNPATYGDWVGGENSIATADLSLQNIRTQLLRPVKDATGRNPDFVTVASGIYDAVKALLDDKAETVQEIRVGDGMINIKQAFGGNGFYIDQVPFIEDRHCTASTMYAWSRRFVQICQLPAAIPAASTEEVQQAVKMLTGVDVPLNDIEERVRALRAAPASLRPTIEMIPKTGDAYKAMVKVYLQIKWRRRNAHAKLVLT